MQQWKSWASVLFAVVLSLGLVVGMAAADGPPFDDEHPGCDNSGNQPPGCDDDGHPGDPGDPGDDEDGDDPLAPVGDACHQVIDEAVANGAPPEFEEGRQVCDALGGSQDDDDDENGDDEEGDDPLAPVGDGCHQVIDEAVANGAPPEIEEARQLCEALGGSQDDDDGDDGDDGDEEGDDPLAPVGDGCHDVIDEAVANGAPPEFEEGRQVCDALGGSQDDDGDDGDDGDEEGDDPLEPVGEGCNQVIDEAVGAGAPPELEEGKALCDAIGGGDALGLG